VVAPPSVHASGTLYEFEAGSSLAEIAAVPDWLLELLADDRAQAQEGGPRVKVEDLRVSDNLKRLIKDGKPQGERSEAIFAVLRGIVVEGYEDDVIESVMLDPANGLSEKPREEGPAWLQGEIRRARDKPSSSVANGAGPKATSGLLVRLADVEPEDIQWLFPPYIPLGKVTLIEGDPGLGKSRLTHALAAAVSRGQGLLNGPSRPPRPVLLLTMEDGLADTVRPHLERLGADLSVIHAYSAPPTLDQKGLAMLERHIVEHRPGLVIIDPLQGAMGGKIDLHRANETRPFMAALAELANRYSCAIICVRHLTKGARDRAIYRGIGSIDITGAARSILQVGIHPEDKGLRVLAHAKSNLGPFGPSWSFTISDKGTFEWGEEVRYTAEDLFRPAMDEESQTALGEATSFLREILSAGPVAQRKIEQKAGDRGIKKRTLDRAKKKLGVRSRKQPDGWSWELPQQDGQGK
jgi:DNA repair protein RadA/Sms